MKIILFGAPGGGKGTQSLNICNEFGIQHISTGDILRQAVKQQTTLGREIAEIISDGKLVSDEIIIAIIKERLSYDDCKQGFLLDGFPRTLHQARYLDSCEISFDSIIELVVSDDVIVERLSGRRVHIGSNRIYHTSYNPPKVAEFDDLTGEPLVHRSDDHKDVILQRLSLYHGLMDQLRAFYQQHSKQYRYVLIDGDGTMAEVYSLISRELNKSRGT